ncbi:MAG: hypothetical protein JWQ23_1299 [Herminiimonas sp.]|nr:hypothetical protein [Herminiimonas sp.]
MSLLHQLLSLHLHLLLSRHLHLLLPLLLLRLPLLTLQALLPPLPLLLLRPLRLLAMLPLLQPTLPRLLHLPHPSNQRLLVKKPTLVGFFMRAMRVIQARCSAHHYPFLPYISTHSKPSSWHAIKTSKPCAPGALHNASRAN